MIKGNDLNRKVNEIKRLKIRISTRNVRSFLVTGKFKEILSEFEDIK